VLVVMLGLNEAVTPFGKPEADRLTLPLNPFSRFTVIVLCPRVTFKLLGEADRLKSGAGLEALTVKLTEVVCVKLPEVPATVTVTVPTDVAAGSGIGRKGRLCSRGQRPNELWCTDYKGELIEALIY
jgi:hypothetical protein